MRNNWHFWHPASLFFLLSLLVVLASWALSVYGVAWTHPLTGGEVQIQNLLSAEGVRWIVRHAIDHFLDFTPIGLLTIWLAAGSLFRESGCGEACLHYHTLTRQRQRALLHVVVVAVVYLGCLGAATVGQSGILRSAEGSLRHSAFVDGGPLLVAIWIGLAGITFGLSAGRFRSDRDIMQGMLCYSHFLMEYLLTAFFAAQWVACLHQSQLDVYLASQLGIYDVSPFPMHLFPRFLAYLLLLFPFLSHKAKKNA